MRPAPWQPPVALAPAEVAIIRRIRRAKRFVFLREHRHALFDAAFRHGSSQAVFLLTVCGGRAGNATGAGAGDRP